MIPTQKIQPHMGIPIPQVAALRVMDRSRIIWLDKLLQDKPFVSIGRTNRRTVRIKDHTVSREHCVIRRTQDGHYVIEDRGSTNGLYVARYGAYSGYHRVDRQRLTVGMHIQVGNAILIAVDGNGETHIMARRYTEFLRLACATYGNALQAAAHIGRRSQQVVLRALRAVKGMVSR